MIRRLFLGSIIFSTRARIGSAQLLSAYEQAYGRWNIKLSKNIFTGRRWHVQSSAKANIGGVGSDLRWRSGGRNEGGGGDLQLLFPDMPRERRVTLHDDNYIQCQTRNEHTRTTTKSVRSVSCILNLEKNGKFSLSLVEEADEDNNHDEKSSPGKRDQESSDYTPPSLLCHSTSINHQPLRGEWYLTPNPYCVTDRHYDELLLVSEPRMRRRSNIIEKARVELRCQVWGRYGAGAVRKKIGLEHGRIRGRMNHGTIVIVKEDVEDGIGSERKGKKYPTTREVVGTFGGRAIVDIEFLGGDHGSLENTDELPGEEEEDDDNDDFDENGVLRPID
jgi:hypothetical protein